LRPCLARRKALPFAGILHNALAQVWLWITASFTLGPGAAAYLTESMNGAGSPQAQRIMLARLADLEEKTRLARRLAGIQE
jgi:4-hydroxybutyryl-CoA dehydratase/vinylacetyl-CoA-Delta-isomerase